MSKETQRHKRRFRGRHSTLIEAAVPIVRKAYTLREEGVERVSFGGIKRTKRGRRKIEFAAITGGWRITVCVRSVRQELFVYVTGDLEHIRNALNEAFK